MKPSRQGKYRQVEEFLPHPGRVGLRGDREGPPPPADRGRAAADGRPGLRQRVPDVRGPAVPHPRARAARRGDRGRRAPAVRATTTPRSPPASAWPPTSSWVASPTPCSTRLPTWCSPCTPATPPPTTRSRGRSAGTRRSCWPRRAATTTSPRSCARTPRPRRTPCSPGTASCASGSPTRSPTRCGPSCCGCRATASTSMQFVESKHTPRNTLLRAVRTGGPVSGGAVRTEYDDLVATWGIRPEAGRAPRRGRPCVSGTCSG